MEDIDTRQEDHIYDECRYVLMDLPISPRRPEETVPRADDPLNQRATVGWKLMHVAKRLVEQYMVRIESCSEQFSDVPGN